MNFSFNFQKMCQVETRRLLWLIGITASFVIAVQFLSLPYGNILLSLFPVGKAPLFGKGNLEDGPKPVMNDGFPLLNNSNSSHLSVPNVVVRNAEPRNTGEGTNLANGTNDRHGDQADGPSNASELDGDIELDGDSPDKLTDLNKNYSFEKENNQYNGSILESNIVPEKSFLTDQVKKVENDVSLDSFQSEDTGLALDRVGFNDTDSIPPLPVLPPLVSETGSPSEQIKNSGNNLSLDGSKTRDNGLASDEVRVIDNGSLSSPPVLPQVISSNNLSFQIEMDGSLSTSNSFDSNMSKQVLPKDEKSELSTQSPTTPVNNSPISKPVNKGNGQIPPPSVTSISEMNHLFLQAHASSQSMRAWWSSVRDQEILSAKLQIQNAPIVKKDRELYAPLFRNVSTFKRSYELMEKILKVYIYKEGAKPVFHQPSAVLKGIYASEGWFMKHIEENKHFVVKDPRQAHLFYLPFSSRMLEESLYVPNSHSHKNLVAYLKDYLDLITAKYPFWNRTGGADHFLVACHDWAPTETKYHMFQSIRAMCNADVNEGFVVGKDVSLPETYVHLAKNPLRDLGGRPPSKRSILAFFAGRMHGYLRPILLQHWENKDPDMKIYGRMGGKKGKASYVHYMKSSKYCICAKGYEVNSPRIVEAIFYECVPVIISDNYVPPFFEVLNWEEFAVFVPEKDIPNLKNILLSIPQEKYLHMQMTVRKVQQHFLWHTKPVKYDLFHMILHSIWYNRVFGLKPT